MGAEAQLDKVELKIEGVEAQALLKAKLDNVTAILERVLLSLDRNPALLRSVGRSLEDVGAGTGDSWTSRATRSSTSAREPRRRSKDVGKGTGQAVDQVGKGASEGVEGVGKGAKRGVDGRRQGRRSRRQGRRQGREAADGRRYG